MIPTQRSGFPTFHFACSLNHCVVLSSPPFALRKSATHEFFVPRVAIFLLSSFESPFTPARSSNVICLFVSPITLRASIRFFGSFGFASRSASFANADFRSSSIFSDASMIFASAFFGSAVSFLWTSFARFSHFPPLVNVHMIPYFFASSIRDIFATFWYSFSAIFIRS